MEHEPDDEPLLRSTRLPSATPASARPSLDDQRTRAQELREALDELKAELDGGSRRGPRVGLPAAGRPVVLPRTQRRPGARVDRPPGGGRRFALAAVVAVGVLVAAVGVVRVVAWSLAGTGPATASPPAGSPSMSASAPGRVPTPPATASAAPATGATPGSATEPAPEPGWPAVVLPEGLPASGPGADAPGTEMTAVLGRAGTVDVYERLVVRPGTTSVRLALAPAAALPGPLRGVRARVVQLRVDVDGRAVPATADDTGWRVTTARDAPFTRVVVHYRLAGSLVRVAPAPPGRETLVLRPLTGPVAAAGQDPVVVRLDDPRVGAVYCPSAPVPLCAVSRGSRHVATVPAGGRPIVLAQVTGR